MEFVIVSADFVKTGGMDRANYALTEHLLKQGHEVHLVAYRIANSLRGRSGLFFHCVPKIFGSYFLSHFLLDHVGRFWVRKVTARGGRAIVNGGNCVCRAFNWVHYVHAQYAPKPFFGGAFRRLGQSIRHAFYLSEEREALVSAQKVVVNSLQTSRDLERFYGIGPGRSRCVYYGVDAEVFYPCLEGEKIALRSKLGLSSSLHAVFVGGSSDYRKGFDIVYEGWRRLKRVANWDVRLLVVGHDGEVEVWKNMARRDGLDELIFFLGFRTDVPDIMRVGDVFVSPVRYESFGLAAQEALCCGMPAIISRDAGVAELYPSEMRELLLDAPADPQCCVEALLRWRNSLDRFSVAARSFSEKLRVRTWDDMSREIVDFIG